MESKFLCGYPNLLSLGLILHGTSLSNPTTKPILLVLNMNKPFMSRTLMSLRIIDTFYPLVEGRI